MQSITIGPTSCRGPERQTEKTAEKTAEKGAGWARVKCWENSRKTAGQAAEKQLFCLFRVFFSGCFLAVGPGTLPGAHPAPFSAVFLAVFKVWRSGPL